MTFEHKLKNQFSFLHSNICIKIIWKSDKIFFKNPLKHILKAIQKKKSTTEESLFFLHQYVFSHICIECRNKHSHQEKKRDSGLRLYKYQQSKKNLLVWNFQPFGDWHFV